MPQDMKSENSSPRTVSSYFSRKLTGAVWQALQVRFLLPWLDTLRLTGFRLSSH